MQKGGTRVEFFIGNDGHYDEKFQKNKPYKRRQKRPEVKEKNRNKASNYFIQNARALKKLKAETNYVTIRKEEDVEFVESVKKLLEIDCYNPLGVLCDQVYFNSLNEREKEFYILNLSEKYRKVKEEVMCG